MREITLTKGFVSMVDDEDFDHINQWKWQATMMHGSPYATRKERRAWNGSRVVSRSFYLHREVMGLKHGDKRKVDHRSPLLTLDNRKENLRFATNSGIGANRHKPKNNTTGFKGVCRQGNRFRSEIRVKRKKINLGTWATPEEASAAYAIAAVKYFGEFARAE